MDFSNCKPFDPTTLYKPKYSGKLNRSICVPSQIQSYSLCIEYIKYWFLRKFPKDFFKTIYVDGKNPYDEFRKLSKVQMLKRQKPALAINPTISWDFDDEKLDFHAFGLNVYAPMGLFRDAFFKDYDHNIFLGISMEKLLFNFTFRMKFETRAQQMDMYKYIKLACRVGSTHGEDVDLDFHVPYDLMLQIAHDIGYEICYEENRQARIVNIRKFLGYLNSHSPIPFLYKYRTINGKHEFFMRMQAMYIHFKSLDLSADDGEREGHMMNNFTIEWNVEVRFPAPKLYAYYSKTEHKLQTLYGAWYQPDGVVSSFYLFKGFELPETNRYGWIKYLYTTYEEDSKNIGKTIDINIGELFEEGDISEIIHECLCNMISPAIFIEPVVINDAKEMRIQMDWESMTLHVLDPLTSPGSFLVFYVDMEYMNTALITKREMDKNRLAPSKKPKKLEVTD